MIVGSWANNQFIDRDPVVSESFFSTTVYAKEGYYLMLEGSPTSASNLEWLVSRFLPLEEGAGEGRGKIGVRSLQRGDGCGPAGRLRHRIPALPLRSNVNPAARGALIGLEGWHTRRHVMRAVYGGHLLLPPAGTSKRWRSYRPLPGVIRMAGGAARLRPVGQLFADALRRPVETTRGTELGTLGAAMCAAVCAGAYPDVGAAADRHGARGRAERARPGRGHGLTIASTKTTLRAIEALDGYWRGR